MTNFKKSFVGFFLITSLILPISLVYGQTQELLPAFIKSGNLIRPRDTDADFILFGTSSTSNDKFSINLEGNDITLFGSGSFNGFGLTDCDAESQTLNWDLTTKRFSCLTDGTGGGGGTQIELSESLTQDSGTLISSISFDPGGFNVTFPAGGLIKLDWGAGGPASLSEAETITGNWVNTANPWADNEVVDTLTINGGVVTWTDLTTYPTGCTNQFVTAVGDTLTCDSINNDDWSGTDLALINGGTASSSADPNADRFLFWDDSRGFVGWLVPDSTLTITGTDLSVVDVTCTGCLGTTEIAGLDISADTNLTAGTDLTLTNDDLTLDSTLTQAFSFSNTGSQTFTGSVDVSKGLHALAVFTVTGSSSFNGGVRGSGLTDCDAAADTLNWDITSGKFSCGSDTGGSVSSNSLNFDEFQNPLVLDLNITVTSATFNWDWNRTALFDIGPASFSNNLSFFGELKPDDVLCANNDILKKTGSLDWDCAVDDDVPDAADYTNLTGGTGITNSPTGTINFDATELDALTWDAGSLTSFTWTFNLTAGDPVLDFTTSGVSTSLGFEVRGSASFDAGVRGSGLADCDLATDTLNWDITSGKFSCGTDDDIPEVGDFTNLVGGSGIDNNSGTLDFDATELDALTWDAGTLTNFAWTFDLSGIDPVLTFRTGTFDFTGGASFSQGVEFATYASVSQRFQLPLNGTVSANRDITVDPDGPGQLVFFATGSEQVLTDEHYINLSIGSTSFNAFTSRSLGEQLRGITVERIWCKAQNATSVVINLTDETNNDMDQITCNTTGAFDDGTIANATLTKGEELYLERRTITGQVDYLPIVIRYRLTRE